jgi:hypothetical protein
LSAVGWLRNQIQAVSSSSKATTRFLGGLTTIENVEFGLRVQGVPSAERRARAREALAIGQFVHDRCGGRNVVWGPRYRLSDLYDDGKPRQESVLFPSASDTFSAFFNLAMSGTLLAHIATHT